MCLRAEKREKAETSETSSWVMQNWVNKSHTQKFTARIVAKKNELQIWQGVQGEGGVIVKNFSLAARK